jgi:GDP-4-dehydro-6-deoxy-D-mannose reductase
LKAAIVRPFFLIGPRKTGDVCSDWAKSVAEIERGFRSQLAVGNLEVVRDFLPVEDGVRALALVAERGRPGSAYNICSGEGWNLRDVLDLFVACARCSVSVRIDQNLLRPVDERVKIGDSTRLKELGWNLRGGVPDAVNRTLDYWRQMVR